MTDTLNAHVAANIRAEVARRKLRQEDVAEGLRMTRASVSALLNGQTALTLGKVQQVAEFLGVEPSKLLND